MSLRAEGRISEAQQLYERIIDIDPQDATAHYRLGQLLVAQRIESQRALELHERAVSLDPNLAAAHRDLGILLASRGNARQAVFHLERAVELNPDDALATEILAKAQSILRESK